MASQAAAKALEAARPLVIGHDYITPLGFHLPWRVWYKDIGAENALTT